MDGLDERLTRIEAQLTLVANQAANTAGRVVVVLSLLVAIMSLAVGGYAYQRTIENHQANEQLCAFVDAEHDARRSDIINQERLLLGPFAKAFPLSASERRLQHILAKQRYDALRQTRPGYCPPREAPTPYPTLKELGG